MDPCQFGLDADDMRQSIRRYAPNGAPSRTVEQPVAWPTYPGYPGNPPDRHLDRTASGQMVDYALTRNGVFATCAMYRRILI